MATQTDRERLYRQVRTELGAPIRQVEITDDMLCTLLEVCVEDYSEVVQNWLVHNQWPALFGQNIDNIDIAFALSTRSIDFAAQFSYAYSKQVGLQARGPWELKKDFIEVVPGQQVYQIPAGRELNEVLWITPNSTDHALFANYGGFDYGFGGGFAQHGSGYGAGSGGGQGAGGGYYIAPAYDVLLTAQDFSLKNKLLRSELTFKLTAGPNGTRLLHLMSTPGSKLTFGQGGIAGGTGMGSSAIGLAGCHVWYHYYDTSQGDADECRKANKDIILMPNDVPLDRLEFETFNEPTKVLIRQLLVAKSKITLGRVRGKYSGALNIPNASVIMDYQSLLSEGIKDWDDTIKKINDRLANMSNLQMLKDMAEEAEALNKQLKYVPMGIYMI